MNRLRYIFLVSLLALTGCNLFQTNEVFIDNPTLSDLKVTIGEESFDLPSFESHRINLKSGIYQVACSTTEDSVLLDEKITLNESGLLNPTKATYVVWKEIYVDENISAEVTLPTNDLNLKENVEVNGKNYNDVDFTIYEEDLFIEKHWDYDVDQGFPETIPPLSDYLIKSKIYRVDDLEIEWGYFGQFEIQSGSDVDMEFILDSLQQLIDSTNLVQ